MALNVDYQIGRVEAAEQGLARELARIDAVMAGRQPYIPDEESAQRERAWAGYSQEVETVQDVFRNEIASAEQARELVEAELANPRLTWTGEQVAESNAHLTAIERDLATYSVGELVGQMRAVLAGQSATQILAWRDALNARHRMLESSGGAADVRAAVATWAGEFDKRVRERPTTKRRLQDADERLNSIREGHRRVRDLTRPRYVEAEHGRLRYARL